MSESLCLHCGMATPRDARFCPHCGKKISPPRNIRFSLTLLLAVLFCGTTLWLIASFLQSALAGTKPEAQYRAEEKTYEDPVLQRLRDAVRAEPGNAGTLQALAQKLEEEVKKENDPRSPLAAELIDTLSTLSELTPADDALTLKLADISFDLLAFRKAVVYYETYLKKHAKDVTVRGRYASTLIFLSRYEDALKELKSILKADPNNFHAHAYLAIAYAQTGEIDKARKTGAAALKLSPNEEARERFTRFLNSLSINDEATDPLVNFIRSNPVAGPKFERADKIKDGTLKVYLRDFPMSAMPPVAREKFLGGIRARVRDDKRTDVKTLIFADAESGKELDRLSFP